MYTLKQIPEDFVVKEISNVQIENNGRFLYFKLKKTNRNTLDVVKQIAKQLKIKEKLIGFAGSKDKHAVTEQIISLFKVNKEKVLDVKIDNVELEFLGYGNKPISLGDLTGNYFEIIVRNLEDYSVNKTNFVENYFDEQRFSKNNAKIGKFMIKKEFSEALKLIDNQKCNEHLQSKPNDFIGALKKIPKRLLRMYINAYQSYLWNETVGEYLRKNSNKEIAYSLGKFVFVEEKSDLDIPLVGFNEDIINNEIINKLMEKEKITFSDFIIRQIPELSLEGELRKVFVEIKDLNVGKEEKDDLNDGKKKIKLTFSLLKGSYATMVVRKLIDLY